MNPWYILSIAVIYVAMWWMTALKLARASFARGMKEYPESAKSYEKRLQWRRQSIIYGMVMAIPWPLTLALATIRDDFRNHDLMSVIPPTQEEIDLLNQERQARISGLEREIWKRQK